MARDTERSVPFLAATRAAFGLALDSSVWSRRSLLLGLLLALPLVFALVYQVLRAAGSAGDIGGFDVYGRIVLLYWLRNVLPLAALFGGSALVADELEGRTLGLLLCRPAPRGALLLGKFLAYLAAGLAVLWPAQIATFALLAGVDGLGELRMHLGDLLRDLGVLGLAFAAYGSLFALLGVTLRRPLIPGLLYLFVWELLAHLPGYLPRVTLTAWLRSLLPYRPVAEGFSEMFATVLPAGWALAVALGVTAGCLLAALWIFSRREFVVEG